APHFGQRRVTAHAELGGEVRPRDVQPGLIFFDTRDRLFQILVLVQRDADQLLELVVAEEFPPGQIGDGLSLLACHAEGLRGGNAWTRIVRSHRAGDQHQREQGQSQAVHQCPPSAGGGPASTAPELAAAGLGRRCASFPTNTKSSGTKKMARKVAASMPPKTPVPMERRPAAPAPVAKTSGVTPMMNAMKVMMIGRNRSFAASMDAAVPDMPAWYRCLAKSTRRIAFLAERPIRVTSPIRKKMSLVIPRSHTADNAPKTAQGTARITA